jgi:hypothetical protein
MHPACPPVPFSDVEEVTIKQLKRQAIMLFLSQHRADKPVGHANNRNFLKIELQLVVKAT